MEKVLKHKDMKVIRMAVGKSRVCGDCIPVKKYRDFIKKKLINSKRQLCWEQITFCENTYENRNNFVYLDTRNS